MSISTLPGLEKTAEMLGKKPSSMKLAVAMSGGVDSSTAAAMACSSGLRVIGITLRLYDACGSESNSGCCAPSDIIDAATVASELNIPHYVLDYRLDFKNEVIDYFTESYISGETPAPCTICNKKIKFGSMLDAAKALDCDALVTGHYVSKGIASDGSVCLRKARDNRKDQSYFLFGLNTEQIKRSIFPMGDKEKSEVREIAKKMQIRTAQKPDSQDICFVPKGKIGDMIAKIKPEKNKPGDILNYHGLKIGEHNGAFRYTVGQRRGLQISSSEPLYVIKTDMKNNLVFVGPKKYLLKDKCFIRSFETVCSPKVFESNNLCVKIRAMSPRVPAKITLLDNNRAVCEFLEPQEGVAPGQVCAVYEGDLTIGGGFIEPDDADNIVKNIRFA